MTANSPRAQIVEELIEAEAALAKCRAVFAEAKKRLDERIERDGPIRVGDVVICNDYTHKGKPFKVETVWLAYQSYRVEGDVSIVARGSILKVDGTPGLRRGRREIDATMGE